MSGGSARVILGIWGYSADYPGIAHDSGASLVVDGRLVAAANEERFSRKKNDAGFPFQAIESVLGQAGLTAKDVDVVALSGLPPFRRGLKIARYTCRTFLETGRLLSNR
ncbi:MAG: carbamoyltransferase N-terminal domain-containing protein, partial [Acidobacteriota bacterium]